MAKIYPILDDNDDLDLCRGLYPLINPFGRWIILDNS
jgi:hypothetical protein